MLIFDEKKQFERLTSLGFEKYPNKRDLLILCKFWLKQGCGAECLKDKMVEFCNKWNSKFNYAKTEPLFLRVLQELFEEKEKNFEFCKEISIYTEERDSLLAFPNKKMARVLFVMICLAKWRNANYIYLNSGSSIKLNDIFELARVKATTKEKHQILYQLNELGFIDVQLKPILKIFIPIIKEGDETPIADRITMSDDVVEWILNFILPHCARCGKPFEKNNNKQIYCKFCRAELDKEQKLKYIHKIRGVEQ